MVSALFWKRYVHVTNRSSLEIFKNLKTGTELQKYVGDFNNLTHRVTDKFTGTDKRRFFFFY